MQNHQYRSITGTLGEADLTAHVDFYAMLKVVKQKNINNIRHKKYEHRIVICRARNNNRSIDSMSLEY